MVALVLLLLLLLGLLLVRMVRRVLRSLLWLLQLLLLMLMLLLLMVYPALRVITASSVGLHSSEWGPILLLLLRILRILRRMTCEYSVFGRHRGIVLLLQKRIKMLVFVLLCRRGQVRVGSPVAGVAPRARLESALI